MSEALTRQASPVSLATQSHYIIRRNYWSFLERTFRAFTMDGQVIMVIKHPVFKLREEFMVYEDEEKQRPILKVKSQQAIAINFNFDITDAQTGQLLGTVQKRGLKSLIRDKFLILDANGTEIGSMEEKGASILRRIFPFLLSKHEITMHGQQAAYIKQIFRFFTKEFDVKLDPQVADKRFVLACALLALIAEARREDKN